MVAQLLQAAEVAASEGTSVEVVDLRSLAPIDYAPLVESVQKTGRLVVAQEAPGNVSVGSEVAATVAERAFYSLEAPVLRVSGFDTPFPPAKLEGVYLPDVDRILEAVDRALAGDAVEITAGDASMQLSAPGADVAAAEDDIVLTWHLECPPRARMTVSWRLDLDDPSLVVRGTSRDAGWAVPEAPGADPRLHRWLRQVLPESGHDRDRFVPARDPFLDRGPRHLQI